MRVNTSIIQSFDPCPDRFNNWLKHYEDFDGSLLQFLRLTKISTRDKIWVAANILSRKDRFLLEVFAIDCAFKLNNDPTIRDVYNGVANTYIEFAITPDADTTSIATAAFTAAAVSGQTIANRTEQIESLIYLLTNKKGK